MDGLDEGRVPRVITQRCTDLVDGVGEGVVGDELGRPHPVDDLEPRHHLARPLGQTHQHIHHLELELDRRVAPGDAVQRRLDEPFTETKRAPAQISYFDFRGHVEKSVSPTGIRVHTTRSPETKKRPV